MLLNTGPAFTYDLTVNPSVAGQGVMTGAASAIDDDGNLVTAALNGVYDRNGHEIKIYCVDDAFDGSINLAVKVYEHEN